MFNTILVHVARVWERVRVGTYCQEMPLDNIESVDAIVQITEEIFRNDVIQGFINASEEERKDGYWIKNTKEGMSDSFIEMKAEVIIRKEYL